MITLRRNDIHVWRIPLTSLPSAFVLNEEEQTRAARFTFEVHHQRFITAHVALRYILSRYALEPAEKLHIAHSTHGKPYLTSYPQLQFNLSHSENIALCAITQQTPIGIDIEYHRKSRDFLAIAQRFFSENESAQLHALPDHQQLSAFFHTWTCKEAVVKALGTGLQYPLDKFSVSVFPYQPAALLQINDSREWELHAFQPIDDYTAALALPRRQNQLIFFEFSENLG